MSKLSHSHRPTMNEIEWRSRVAEEGEPEDWDAALEHFGADELLRLCKLTHTATPILYICNSCEAAAFEDPPDCPRDGLYCDSVDCTYEPLPPGEAQEIWRLQEEVQALKDELSERLFYMDQFTSALVALLKMDEPDNRK